MSGNTVTQSAPSVLSLSSAFASAVAPAATGAHCPSVALSRAAREMDLERGEFELAVQLGCVRTVPDDGGGGGRRVARAEIDRVRSEKGFPEVLLVRDPYERSYLNRFRPERTSHGAPESPAAHIASRIMTAEDTDEISWLRAELGQALAEARDLRPAPRPASKASWPGDSQPAGIATGHAQRVVAAAPGNASVREETERSRGLLGWLRRRTL